MRLIYNMLIKNSPQENTRIFRETLLKILREGDKQSTTFTVSFLTIHKLIIHLKQSQTEN